MTVVSSSLRVGGVQGRRTASRPQHRGQVVREHTLDSKGWE